MNLCIFISLQESLGDVVYAQLPEADDAVAAGEDCGALESVKERNCAGLPCRKMSFFLVFWLYDRPIVTHCQDL